MLLRFGVSNHLSLRDRQELSFIASSLDDDRSSLIKCEASPEGAVAPVAVIYGANAAGKSNVISALQFMRSAILHSHRSGQPGGRVPRRPFALDSEYEQTPSSFDADFVIEGVRYHYGFECSNEVFLSEWLYSYPNNKRRKLFERDAGSFSFGRTLKGRNKIISELTRPNSLFLSAAAQNDHEELSKISQFFRSIRDGGDISVSGDEASFLLAKGEIDRRVIDFLRKIGAGVFDYRKSTEEFPEEIRALRAQLSEVFKNFSSVHSNIQVEDRHSHISIELAHRAKDGSAVFFDLSRESSGTRRLLTLLGHVYQALDDGSLVTIDELDASLHTQACEVVLGLFSWAETNPKGAQLIATTHDTNMLTAPILRRDQIWFTEKDEDGATHLYPLTDVRTRRGDNFEKGYLQGRYGAIPFSGSLAALFATD